MRFKLGHNGRVSANRAKMLDARRGKPTSVKHLAQLAANRARRSEPSLYERWNSKVDRSGDCWIWKAARNSVSGYGAMGDGAGGVIAAHRFSYEHHNGPIPEGIFVLHSCHNPPCVNPAHLRVGTHIENMRDMVESGRSKKRHRTA